MKNLMKKFASRGKVAKPSKSLSAKVTLTKVKFSSGQ